jgi:hypothetical protein
MSPYSLRRLPWAGSVATAAAIVVNLSFFAVTKTLGERYIIPLDESGSHLSPMPAIMIVMATLIPGVVATILFGLLIRFTRRPATIFLSVSVTAIILSFGGPFGLPSATSQSKILLSSMHVIAAGIISGGILLMSHKATKVPRK